MYNTNNSRKDYEWINLQTLKKWFVAKIGSCRPSYIWRDRWPEIFSFGTKKAIITHTIYRMINFSWNNCTWVHMFSKYVKFCKYRVDFSNEIIILEMIYRNHTQRHVRAKSTKTIFFHYKYETSKLF
jgi:hypothetical protein